MPTTRIRATVGSELDAAYAKVNGGRLFLMFTGNQEPNFNKLEVFIDSTSGGENRLSATPDYDFFNGSQWISTNLQGLTFDAGFAADYHLFARRGGATNPYEVDFVNRMGGGSAMIPGAAGSGSAAATSIGSIAAGVLGPNASGSSLSQSLDFAINNSNAAGVMGGSASADQTAAQAVTTGMEFSIALADIGNPGLGDVIRISAMINNGDHNYLSNQILGGLRSPQGNLGGDGNGGFTGTLSGVNFNQFADLQYFQVFVPEPASISLLGLGALALLARRRR